MNPNIALVSQGGGTRGAFTAGVQDVLMKENVFFPYVIGTSAGALINSDFVSKDIGRSKVITTEVVANKQFLSLRNLFRKGGIFDFDFLMEELPKELPFNFDEFFSSDVRFVVAATSLETGEATYFEKGKVSNIWAAMAASSSLPLIAKPVEVEGKLYLDGGPVAAIPWRKAVEDGYQKLVVIMTRPKDYRKKAKPSRAVIAMAKKEYRKYPAFLKAYLHYYPCYNEDVEDLLKLEAEGKVFIIAPTESLGVSNHESDTEKLTAVYEKGLKRAEELMPALKEFLNHE